MASQYQNRARKLKLDSKMQFFITNLRVQFLHISYNHSRATMINFFSDSPYFSSVCFKAMEPKNILEPERTFYKLLFSSYRGFQNSNTKTKSEKKLSLKIVLLTFKIFLKMNMQKKKLKMLSEFNTRITISQSIIFLQTIFIDFFFLIFSLIYIEEDYICMTRKKLTAV